MAMESQPRVRALVVPLVVAVFACQLYGQLGGKAISTLSGDAAANYVITAPGAYYLSANIDGQSYKAGIRIQGTGFVTIDLNGYTLDGHGNPNTLAAITTASAGLAITVKNGMINNWVGTGGGIAAGDTLECHFENLTVWNVRGHGIQAGSQSTVLHCIVYSAGGGAPPLADRDGIVVGNTSTVSGCSVFNSTGRGIVVRFGDVSTSMPNSTVISDCTSQYNGGSGIVAGESCVIRNCAVSENGHTSTTSRDGISVGDGCSVIGCTSRSNWRYGIRGYQRVNEGLPDDPHDVRGVTISGCSVYGNGWTGIYGQARETIVDCTVSDNGLAALPADPDHAPFGISVDNGATINRCSVGGNQSGIQIGYRSMVRDCTVESNLVNGIWIEYAYNSVIRNDVHMNGTSTATVGSGILLGAAGALHQASDNRIEGNHVTWNDQGIVIINLDSARNIFVGNSTVNNREITNTCPSLNDFRQYVLADGTVYPRDQAFYDHIRGNMFGEIMSLQTGNGVILRDSNFNGNAWANLDVSLPCQ